MTQGDMSMEVPRRIKTRSQMHKETKARLGEESICLHTRDPESFVWSSSAESPNEVQPESPCRMRIQIRERILSNLGRMM